MERLGDACVLDAGGVESPTVEYERLCREVTMLQARAAEVLGRVDREGLFEDEGYLSAGAWLRDRLGVSAGEAARRVGEARALERYEVVADGYADAVLDRGRVAMLLGAARVSEDQFVRDSEVLVDAVSDLGWVDARRVVEYWKQAADQRGAAADEEHWYRRRRLHVSALLSGMMRVDGELDVEGGQMLLAALGSLCDSQQLDPDDERSPAQRRADALVDICADHLAYGKSQVSGSQRPQVSVIVSAEALGGEAGQPCEFDDGTVIGSGTVRRVACDAAVSRVVMGPDSEILDVGRATRSVPAAIRRALIIRDRHCRHSGCDRPHRWCDAHHIEHWADGGPTSLNNLILLCRRHHRAVHQHQVTTPARE